MPIATCHDSRSSRLKIGYVPVNQRDDDIAIRDSKRPTRAEIILNVGNEESSARIRLREGAMPKPLRVTPPRHSGGHVVLT